MRTYWRSEGTLARVQSKIQELEQRIDEPDMSLFVKGEHRVLREEILPEQKRQHLTKLQQQKVWIAALEMVPSRGVRDPSAEFRTIAGTFGQCTFR